MNIVYLIGNGFDRNLGLRTSYKDFYNFYKKQRSSNEDIRKIKEYIDNGESELWSDLEKALGEITTEFNDPDGFVDILKDISDNLFSADENRQNINKDIEMDIHYLCQRVEHPSVCIKHRRENIFDRRHLRSNVE